MTYAIPTPPQISLPIQGTDERFPIRRIFCVGRNYAAHIREMGNDEREPPLFFTKPADAIVQPGATVPFPMACEDLHHEVELVLAIGTGGANIAAEQAMDHVWGAGVGVDLTRRDIQARVKAKGQPWDMAKAFDASAPMGMLRAGAGAFETGRIWLNVNGETRQDGDLAEMIWPVTDCIAHLSRLVALAPGDLVMTGTPAGVGPLAIGDRVSCGVADLPELEFEVGAPV